MRPNDYPQNNRQDLWPGRKFALSIGIKNFRFHFKIQRKMLANLHRLTVIDTMILMLRTRAFSALILNFFIPVASIAGVPIESFEYLEPNSDRLINVKVLDDGLELWEGLDLISSVHLSSCKSTEVRNLLAEYTHVSTAPKSTARHKNAMRFSAGGKEWRLAVESSLAKFCLSLERRTKLLALQESQHCKGGK